MKIPVYKLRTSITRYDYTLVVMMLLLSAWLLYMSKWGGQSDEVREVMHGAFLLCLGIFIALLCSIASTMVKDARKLKELRSDVHRLVKVMDDHRNSTGELLWVLSTESASLSDKFIIKYGSGLFRSLTKDIDLIYQTEHHYKESKGKDSVILGKRLVELVNRFHAEWGCYPIQVIDLIGSIGD